MSIFPTQEHMPELFSSRKQDYGLGDLFRQDRRKGTELGLLGGP